MLEFKNCILASSGQRCYSGHKCPWQRANIDSYHHKSATAPPHSLPVLNSFIHFQFSPAGHGAKISQLIEYLKLPNRNFKFITPRAGRWSVCHYLTFVSFRFVSSWSWYKMSLNCNLVNCFSCCITVAATSRPTGGRGTHALTLIRAQ